MKFSWGPPDKRPPKTTRNNLNNRLQNINFNELPKTFREAIVLTLGIGVSQLWIDSLCIIQDSDEDWRHESKNMGQIYKQATLVFGAAGSTDSTGGLFPLKRPGQTSLRLPYIVEGVESGEFNAVSLPLRILQEELMDSPLRQRAWAFQEWYLSRRRIFFTTSNIIWLCISAEYNEFSVRDNLRFFDHLSWLFLVREYSSKLLSFPSDRLVALEGIVQDSKRKDRWTFGTWENDLTEQLIWLSEGYEPTGEILTLPSWCWAATGSPVLYPFDQEKSEVDLLEISAIHPSGELHTRGHLLRDSIDLRKMCKKCRRAAALSIRCLEEILLHDSIYYLRDRKQGQDIVGLATLDLNRNLGRLAILVLKKMMRYDGETLYVLQTRVAKYG